MIQTKRVIINNQEFIYTYSDEGRYVVRDGRSYQEAYDLPQFNRTYTEGDIIPPNYEDPNEILAILLGDEGDEEDDDQ